MDFDFKTLTTGITFSGRLKRDSAAFLIHHGYPHTAGHCQRVAQTARRLARRFGQAEAAAAAAGWLHDISAVIPDAQRLAAAHAWDVPVLPEEERLPMILHQKLSVIIAQQIFAVQDPATLSAIGCHTTLKAAATPLDQIVFIADKIAWDQPGTPPYLAELEAALDHSLSAAALVYIDYLWQRREQLAVVHPWLVAARRDLLPA